MKISNILSGLLMLCAIGNTASAQYTITREKYEVNVQQFPEHYIAPAERTYCVKMTNNVTEYLTDSYVTADIDLNGWTEADEEEAFLVMDITMQSINHMGVDFKDNKTEKEIPDGIQIDHHYFPTLKYTFNIKCNFKTKYETFDRKSTPEGGSMVKMYPIKMDFPTQEAARKYIKENEQFINKKIAEEGAKTILEEIRKAINEKYLPSNSSEEVVIGYLLDENNPLEQTMKDAHQYIPKELGLISHESMGSAVSGLNVWLEKFQNAAGDLSMAKPAEKKAKEEMIRNLVSLYYIIEDFDKCTIYAQVLRDTFKSKDGDRYLRMIRALKTDFEKHNQTSRHFVIK